MKNTQNIASLIAKLNMKLEENVTIQIHMMDIQE